MTTQTDNNSAFDTAINGLRIMASTRTIEVGIFEPWVAEYAMQHELDVGWFRRVIDSGVWVEHLEHLVDSGFRDQADFAEFGDAVVALVKESITELGLVDTGTMRDSVTARKGGA